MQADAYLKSVLEDRESWRLEHPQRCMSCGGSSSWPPLAVHEIERRSHAVKCWGHRCNYMLVDSYCHEQILAAAPHAMQLAIKKISDPWNYDLNAWLRLRDKSLMAPRRVTQEEVDEWIENLQRRRVQERSYEEARRILRDALLQSQAKWNVIERFKGGHCWALLKGPLWVIDVVDYELAPFEALLDTCLSASDPVGALAPFELFSLDPSR
ncbi:hypothetical protein VN12_26500 [Pirellula sp. SH-Sr6A]|nr:hypothetical protein VN12_26500 [Pirellula sp. SH-Sr6A]